MLNILCHYSTRILTLNLDVIFVMMDGQKVYSFRMECGYYWPLCRTVFDGVSVRRWEGPFIRSLHETHKVNVR